MDTEACMLFIMGIIIVFFDKWLIYAVAPLVLIALAAPLILVAPVFLITRINTNTREKRT